MKINSSVASATFINELANRTSDLAGMGYLPGNLGCVAVVLSQAKVAPYFWDEFNDQNVNLVEPLPNLKNAFVLITSTNIALRSIAVSSSKRHEYMGIIRLSPTGDSYQIMWGFFRTAPNRKVVAQLTALNAAIKRNPKNTHTIYCSPSYLQEFSYWGQLGTEGEYAFTNQLFASMPYLVEVAPGGLAMLEPNALDNPSELPTIAKKFHTHNVVVIKTQGAFLVGESWNMLIGLATALDRAAQSALTIGDLWKEIDPSLYEAIARDAKVKLNENFITWAHKNWKQPTNGQEDHQTE